MYAIKETTVPQLTQAQAIILTGFTGVVLCDIDAFLGDLNKRLEFDTPIHEAELAIPGNAEAIKMAYAADAQALLPVDWAKEDARHIAGLVTASATELAPAPQEPGQSLIVPNQDKKVVFITSK
jgi:hypothetical protein